MGLLNILSGTPTFSFVSQRRKKSRTGIPFLNNDVFNLHLHALICFAFMQFLFFKMVECVIVIAVMKENQSFEFLTRYHDTATTEDG